jgi:hypothetical protein
MKTVNIIETKDYIILDFCKLTNLQSSETIINILVNKFNAIEITRQEGIGMYLFELEIDNVSLVLINDEYGNSIKAETNNERNIIKRIYNNWDYVSKK